MTNKRMKEDVIDGLGEWGPIEIAIFGRSYCPYCLKAKKLLYKLKSKTKKITGRYFDLKTYSGKYKNKKRMMLGGY